MILEKFQNIYFGKLTGTNTFLLMTDDECVVLQPTDKINKYNIIETLGNKNKLNENVKLTAIHTNDKIQPVVIKEITIQDELKLSSKQEFTNEHGSDIR